MTDILQAKTAAHPERFKATDSCVMCGLCLPHCPTYLKTRHEADSPRGRIALIQALARGELAAEKQLTSHLDGCLVCRACEDMCPSRVPYGHLIVAARAELFSRRHRKKAHSLRAWLMREFTHNRHFRRLAHSMLRGWQGLPGRWPAKAIVGKRLKTMGRLYSYIPSLKQTPLIAMETVPNASRQNKVQLFTGCAGEVFDRETLAAACEVLDYLGYQVLIPSAQTCCGALALHSGDETDARRLASENIRAFRTDLPILSTASGCTATLKDAATWFGEEATDLAHATEDICSFLQRADWSKARLKRAHLRVAVHTPCTLKHVLHTDSAVTALLNRIPGIELFELARNNFCCGAAGQYMIDNPEMADALVDDKITDLRNKTPDVLVSSNIGCAMHIQAAMRRAGLSLEVLHPVNLLARQLKPLAAIKPVA